MKLVKIKEYARYLEVVDRYGTRGCLTNDYIQRDAEDLINQGSLYECCGERNAFLFVKKDGFWRVYYYINDLTEYIIPDEGVLSTEILFRSAFGFPEVQAMYLEGCGFARHLVRNQYSAFFTDMTPSIKNDGINILPARTLMDMQLAFDLFNESFDKLTGDFVSPQSYSGLLASNDVLLAWNEDGANSRFLGALHQTILGNIAWISHIAVRKEERGRHVARALLDASVEKCSSCGISRFMLWVQQQNETAIALYEKKGFKPNGKSSLSMIKQ